MEGVVRAGAARGAVGRAAVAKAAAAMEAAAKAAARAVAVRAAAHTTDGFYRATVVHTATRLPAVAVQPTYAYRR